MLGPEQVVGTAVVQQVREHITVSEADAVCLDKLVCSQTEVCISCTCTVELVSAFDSSCHSSQVAYKVGAVAMHLKS